QLTLSEKVCPGDVYQLRIRQPLDMVLPSEHDSLLLQCRPVQDIGLGLELPVQWTRYEKHIDFD
ncbi:MAG: hypothetical protein R6U78_15610, partial [Bacteroidales bacterium]